VIPFLESATAVDLREKFLDIPSQTAITKDNANIDIDFLVYYRIVDPQLAVLKVENVEKASVLIATTTLRAVIGDIELDDVLSKRESINDTLRTKLDESTERWGMKITSVEIREIVPPKGVMDAMTQQMTAERQRRAEVTRAEGERQASITIAEGQKQAEILKAEGEKQSAILRAEGERQAQLLRAQGYAASLAEIAQKAVDIDQKTMALQYMETLQKIGSSPSTKWVVPIEMINFIQSSMGNALGNNK
jgi:regulator of protease activity HflC (stomatin/prohibitin superfamily)